MKTFYKTITWRLIAMSVTFLSTWWVTGGVEAALSVGAIDTVIKTASYYLHEKAWERGEIKRF